MANIQLSDEYLSARRQIGDPEVDLFIEKSFAEPELKAALYAWLMQIENNSSLNETPGFFSQEQFINRASTLPPWADKKRLKAGSGFFSSHSEQVMQLLGVLSLPYCYAAADGAMVLLISGRLRDDGGKRLADTGEFVMNVQSPGAFDIQGKGFSSILKIRITHAIARYYTQKSGQWKEEWGMPVNQEDMAGTNLAFSLIVIRGLRKLGFSISYDEQQSFLHLWNVIGYLLGLDESLIPQNGKDAFNLEKRISERQFRKSEQGIALTKSLIKTFTELNSDGSVSVKELKQLMVYLLEEKVAGLLEIDSVKVPVYLPYMLKTLTGLRHFKARIPF